MFHFDLDNCHKLLNKYTLWFHNPNDTNWQIDSYHKIITFTTIEEFWTITNYLKSDLIEKGMFFLMKEDIEPIWEDLNNITGGCISFKIDNMDSQNVWIDLMVHLISNNLDIGINGISISPKKKFNIVKIWTNSIVDIDNYTFPDSLSICKSPALFNANEDNVQKDKGKINYYKQRET